MGKGCIANRLLQLYGILYWWIVSIMFYKEVQYFVGFIANVGCVHWQLEIHKILDYISLKVNIKINDRELKYPILKSYGHGY